MLLVMLITAAKANSQVAVIGNKSISEKSLSVETVREIYTLNKQQWANGSKITVFNLRQKDDTKKRLYKILGRNSSELRKLWIRYQLTGEGEAPLAASTEQEMLDKVTATQGAIGYLSMEKVTPAVNVLFIIE